MVTSMNTGDSHRWWALIAIAASVLVVGLDLTVLSLALPVVSTELHASTTDLQWFSAVYSLVLAAALLPAGLGRGRIASAGAADPTVLVAPWRQLPRSQPDGGAGSGGGPSGSWFGSVWCR